MESLAYIPGLRAAEPGPLSRFLPPLEQGTISTWLLRYRPHAPQASASPGWLIDPFGFSPRLVVEAARAGYRVLVTVNNPITRFLLEMAANPPSEADFKAALADLAVSKKGSEHLEAHLQSLYVTSCEKCGKDVEAESFLWRKGEAAPFARIYECKECGDKGERAIAPEDVERAHRIAATDALHRARALERVAALEDDDRVYAEEALQQYLPRPLYALLTIINRLDALHLTAARQRALTALVLLACDAGNTLWGYPAERPRPKALITPPQFREHNIWRMLEHGLSMWEDTGAPVPCVSWPNPLPEPGGICIYEGRLKDLAHEIGHEVPIAAAIGSIPRPNQAFWTFSALWSGWLWGRAAVDPFRVALRRRRYDWAWNATALNAAFSHLFELLPFGTPFFGLLPEAEPPFLTSAFLAMQSAGFLLRGLALRTEHDPVQLLWERSEPLQRELNPPDPETLHSAMEEQLASRAEPARYIQLHTAALLALAEAHELGKKREEFEAALRRTQSAIEKALTEDPRFTHYSSGEGAEAGLWGLSAGYAVESLPDRVEIAVVNYLQRNPDCIYLEIENELYGRFPGLLTPSKGMIYAVLSSYAEKNGANWRLRGEDLAARRHHDVRVMSELSAKIGRRLGYGTRNQDKWVMWAEQHKDMRLLYTLASALVGRVVAANPEPSLPAILVIPGGRAALIAYKMQRDPALAERMQPYQLAKYRLWRALSDAPMLTRATFDEQLSSDPVRKAEGQMLMF